MTEGMRYYVRSQRNIQTFKKWLEDAKPSIPVEVSSRGSNVVQCNLFPLLKTQELGGVVLYGTTLESTQTLLRETLKPTPPAGIVCYTKGRGTNTWSSPEALAIIKAVETVHASELGNAGSWPNDIYANQVKIGGILCQSEYHNGLFSVTTGAFNVYLCLNGELSLAGIGINISNRLPTICLQDVLSTKEAPSRKFLAAFCNVYEPMEKVFLEKGFEPFMTSYLARWLHTDQPVQVANDDEPNGEKVVAIIKGLTNTGCLLAKGDDGSRLELYPDGNSFDFLTGLLKRKL
ncbi:hypothetical protein PsorP6_019162 [Peronosclerospora sorghi]|nr:hypothetical protein PsorP6_019162 [Peronosclerospora sorghi]